MNPGKTRCMFDPHQPSIRKCRLPGRARVGVFLGLGWGGGVVGCKAFQQKPGGGGKRSIPRKKPFPAKRVINWQAGLTK